MNRICAVFLTALLIVWVPRVGAQNSSDVVFQTTTSPQEWPATYASWKAANAANDDAVSANVIGVMAHRIAVSQQHPAAAMEVKDYIRAFFEANPALMPENGTVKLENFLTLAREGKLHHPPVPAAATNEAAPVAVAPVVQGEVSANEAAYRADVAIRRSTEAVDMLARLSVEVEKLASRSTATDPAVLRRLVALEQGLKEVPTTASLKALEGTVTGLQRTVANQITDSKALQGTVTGFQEKVAGQKAGMEALQVKVTALEVAPPKADDFARLLTGGAIVLAFLALILGYLARGRSREARRIADLAHQRTIDVESVQAGHQEHLNLLHRKTEHLRDIKIDPNLIDKLRGLSGTDQHTTRMWVDDDEFRLTFRLSDEAGEQHMFRVEGVIGQNKAFLAKNAISILKRAARDDRVRGVGPSEAENGQEDQSWGEDNVTPISAA